MADSTLQAIRTKVRRLTRSPSEAQITTATIDEYINTFVLYDFPEELRTFNLNVNFTFICNPFQDVYPTDTASFGDINANPTIQYNPLYNFQNKYLTVEPPVFIAGFQSYYTQDRQEFYAIYPFVNSIASIGVTGDNVTTSFSGVINSQQAIVPSGLTQHITLLQNQVLFSSVDIAGEGVSLADVPLIDPVTGNTLPIGNLYDPFSQAYRDAQATPPTVALVNNFINYITGQYTITFSSAPAQGVAINSQCAPQTVSLPQAMLFFQNQFVLRPVPDQPYRINFQVFKRPTELLAANQSPDLEEYWQFLAYGAAKKIFQDRMDSESVQMIEPEFNKQERLCLRRTLVQLHNERVATIYAGANAQMSAGWWNGTGGGGAV